MATGTTVFSRVTVVAPRTRIDVALPADVAVADLLPMLLDMAKEATPDGGVRHGGWCLAKLGDSPLDPAARSRRSASSTASCSSCGARNENPPPPLYDDVVDAIAESDPDSFRPWTKETAQRFGHIAGALALIAAAVALFLCRPAVRRVAAGCRPPSPRASRPSSLLAARRDRSRASTRRRRPAC